MGNGAWTYENRPPTQKPGIFAPPTPTSPKPNGK